VHAAELPCRLGDHALHLLLRCDVGCDGEDAPVRFGSQLSCRRLESLLVPRHDRDIDAFPGQFPRNGFADAPAPASHDRMLALQSQIHGISSPSRCDRNFALSLLIVFRGKLRCKGPCRKGDLSWPDDTVRHR
jgi:hypothetical protein